jgi:hypothetical protein
MRETLLMLFLTSCMAGTQNVSAQTQSGVDPTPAASTAAYSNPTRAATMNAAPIASSEPATAGPMVKENTTDDAEGRKKDDTANMQPDDPRKNPWWEPRDWTYINNSAP